MDTVVTPVLKISADLFLVNFEFVVLNDDAIKPSASAWYVMISR